MRLKLIWAKALLNSNSITPGLSLGLLCICAIRLIRVICVLFLPLFQAFNKIKIIISQPGCRLATWTGWAHILIILKRDSLGNIWYR